jgi:DinB family protein
MQADLQKILDELDAVDRSVEALTSGLTDEQFFWRPDGGRAWSIAQCLEHLAVGNTVYIAPMRAAVERAAARGPASGAPIRSSIFGRWFIGTMEPPVRRRMKAPTRIVPPSSRSREQIAAAFGAAHDGLREIVRAADRIDVNRATFPNPFLSLVKMRVGTALRVLTAHDRRHVWQAENVRKRPDFPSGR